MSYRDDSAGKGGANRTQPAATGRLSADHVHLARSALPLNRYLVEWTLPEDLWEDRAIFDPGAHVGWDAAPAGQVSLDWGTAWVRSRSSAIAEVPSVIVPEETNALLNPRAPGFQRLRVRKVRRWLYHLRLRG